MVDCANQTARKTELLAQNASDSHRINVLLPKYERTIAALVASNHLRKSIKRQVAADHQIRRDCLDASGNALADLDLLKAPSQEGIFREWPSERDGRDFQSCRVVS